MCFPLKSCNGDAPGRDGAGDGQTPLLPSGKVVANSAGRSRCTWRTRAPRFEAYPDRFRAEAIAPIQNKVGAFLSSFWGAL
jgi:hypothetical protein